MDFFFNMDEWRGINAEQATLIIAHLPPTVWWLYIKDAKFGKLFINAVIDHVAGSSNMKTLTLYDTLASKEEERREVLNN